MSKPTVTAAEKLEKVRRYFQKYDIDAFLVPSTDEHNSEYPPDYNLRREYITEFTGSAGTALITLSEALLWVDGRYFIQAEEEVDLSVWTIMKLRLPGVPTLTEWISQSNKIHKIGFDPTTLSVSLYERFMSVFKDSQYTKKLVSIQDNLIDLVWGSQRPKYIRTPVFDIPVNICGSSVQDKIQQVRKAMEEEAVDLFVTAQLDDIAWFCNGRASDISYCPVFISYLTISLTEIILYIDSMELSTENFKAELLKNKIIIKPYHSIFSDVPKIHKDKKRTWMDDSTNYNLYSCFKDLPTKILLKTSIITMLKAVKNSVELELMKLAHYKDACAVTAFLAWMDFMQKKHWKQFSETHTEFTLAETLDKIRCGMENSRNLSFPTISSLRSNSAIIHYSVKKETAFKVTRDIYLVDSGGQYLEGTTDVTRTVHFGTPTALQKRVYTLVLKGHLCLKRQKFPEGTRGLQLDILARSFLWENGFDYMHGTGHGVGCFLCVHEGPQYISQRAGSSEVPLQPGMVLSNEPGCYFEHDFGVRIENLMYIEKIEKIHPKQIVDFYQFKDLTFIPYDKSLLDLDLLTDEELQEINDYHQIVFNILIQSKYLLQASSLVTTYDICKEWLVSATEPICRDMACKKDTAARKNDYLL